MWPLAISPWGPLAAEWDRSANVALARLEYAISIWFDRGCRDASTLGLSAHKEGVLGQKPSGKFAGRALFYASQVPDQYIDSVKSLCGVAAGRAIGLPGMRAAPKAIFCPRSFHGYMAPTLVILRLSRGDQRNLARTHRKTKRAGRLLVPHYGIFNVARFFE